MSENAMDYFRNSGGNADIHAAAYDLSKGIPRPEYPRPQFRRECEWINLNGEWDFAFDFSSSGLIRGRIEDKLKGIGFDRKIIVPFCPESVLSGINYTDFIPAVWYHRTFNLTTEQLSKKVILHFGAVDYEAHLYINGTKVIVHKGGYTPFEVDITSFVHGNENNIALYVLDDVRSGRQPCGKQAFRFNNENYSRVTGIWQTVWLEFVADIYIKNFKLIPQPENRSVSIQVRLNSAGDNLRLRAEAVYEGQIMGSRVVNISGDIVSFELDLSEVILWEPGHGNLYDLKFTLFSKEAAIDSVDSYFGMRTVTIGENVVKINGKPVFQRLVLDQDYHVDGIYTAEDESVYRQDIEKAMKLGFNGARMHQKIFDPIYIYYADKTGFLLWGEHASWGLDITSFDGAKYFIPEWRDMLERDFNSPAIVVWCPFNESVDEIFDTEAGGIFKTNQDDDVLKAVYYFTKDFDPTRPVIDTSGYFHVVTDIFDVHDYDQDPESLKKRYDILYQGKAYINFDYSYFGYPEKKQVYHKGQPYMVSEFGGAFWANKANGEQGFGYGKNPQLETEFVERFKGLTEALMENPFICGFCYTQLYDVEQEMNGFYTQSRIPKFSDGVLKEFRKALTQKAAVEK